MRRPARRQANPGADWPGCGLARRAGARVGHELPTPRWTPAPRSRAAVGVDLTAQAARQRPPQLRPTAPSRARGAPGATREDDAARSPARVPPGGVRRHRPLRMRHRRVTRGEDVVHPPEPLLIARAIAGVRPSPLIDEAHDDEVDTKCITEPPQFVLWVLVRDACLVERRGDHDGANGLTVGPSLRGTTWIGHVLLCHRQRGSVVSEEVQRSVVKAKHSPSPCARASTGSTALSQCSAGTRGDRRAHHDAARRVVDDAVSRPGGAILPALGVFEACALAAGANALATLIRRDVFPSSVALPRSPGPAR